MQSDVETLVDIEERVIRHLRSQGVGTLGDMVFDKALLHKALIDRLWNKGGATLGDVVLDMALISKGAVAVYFSKGAAILDCLGYRTGRREWDVFAEDDKYTVQKDGGF